MSAATASATYIKGTVVDSGTGHRTMRPAKSGLRDDEAGVGRRAALTATGSQECRQADASIVDLVPAPGMLAQELAVDLGQAVHRRRPLRGRLVDRPGCARSVRRDRGGEHEPRDLQQANGLEHVQHAGRIGLVCGSRALLGTRREDAGRVEQDIRPSVAHGPHRAGHEVTCLDPHGRVVAQRWRGGARRPGT